MPTGQVLWLVPALLAVHNAEEALFFPRYLPLVLAHRSGAAEVRWPEALLADVDRPEDAARLGVRPAEG